MTIFGFSCKVFNPEDEIPSYLYIDDIVVSTTANQGTESDNIIDAWVYVDGSLIGTYELPSKIPIHKQGNCNVQIFAGIKSNTLTNIRVVNDFFEPYEFTHNSISNKVDTITPVVTYESTAKIWIEDFEDPGVKFNKLSYSDTNVFITNNAEWVFEGNGSGVIRFDDSHLFFEAKTNETTFNSFPKAGRPVYIEIDYNSNEVITLGFYHNNTSSIPVKYEFINLNPTNGIWKKAYINLADGVSRQISASIFDIYIEVEKNKSVKPEVFIDNIKVIY